MDDKILVIEDDELVALTVQTALKKFGYQALVAPNGRSGIQKARRYHPDAIVLDVIMPGLNGYDVCREMRRDPLLKEMPILFLTAKVEDNDRIEGFLAGGDDYLAKPFNLQELNLRLRALLRRAQPPKEDVPFNQYLLEVGDVALNCRTFEVSTPKGTELLTNVQFDLLYHLMSNPGQIFSAQQLLQDVWDYPPRAGSPELVRAHVRNLREKIEVESGKPKYVKTIKGHGYTFATH
jgi:DNA-binding response OmpR family regulator